MCRIVVRNHASADETSRRASVTRKLYANGCLSAKYRSPLIKTRWISEAEHRGIEASFVAVDKVQNLLVFSLNCNNDSINAMKRGCTTTPTTRSDIAMQARSTLGLLALNRDFVFTAIITSAFKKVVKGNVTMLMAKTNMRTALAPRESGLLPKTKLQISHPGDVISTLGRLEFIASRFFTFSLLSTAEFFSTQVFSTPFHLASHIIVLRKIDQFTHLEIR